jgi:hypothetical protein
MALRALLHLISRWMLEWYGYWISVDGTISEKNAFEYLKCVKSDQQTHATKTFFAFPSTSRLHFRGQGCQMVYFQTKNRSLGTFWRALQCKMLVYFMDIWSILGPFYIFLLSDVFCGNFVYFSPFWCFAPRKIWQPCFEGRVAKSSIYLLSVFLLNQTLVENKW